MATHSFSGAKFRIARTFHGLTQIELAQRLSCDQSLIGHIERGQKRPSAMVLDAICHLLGFEASFFAEPPVDEFLDEECNFRRRKTTTVSARARALSHGTLFVQLVRLLDEWLELPADAIPERRVGSDDSLSHADRAAEVCRTHWGLGLDRPIENMCRAIESNGAVATRIDGGSQKVDAFSRAGGRHIVVLTSNKGSPSRSRFDAAHELGHLVMHRGRPTGTKESEAQADRFASSFLLPRAGFMREFPQSYRVDWERVFDIKQHWGASAAAIVRRAYDLDLIDAVQYQQAYKHMAWKRWSTKGEPHEPLPEYPETVRFGCETLREHFGETPDTIAKKLGWGREILQRVVAFDLPEDESLPDQDQAGDNVVFLDSRRPIPARSADAPDVDEA